MACVVLLLDALSSKIQIKVWHFGLITIDAIIIPSRTIISERFGVDFLDPQQQLPWWLGLIC